MIILTLNMLFIMFSVTILTLVVMYGVRFLAGDFKRS